MYNNFGRQGFAAFEHSVLRVWEIYAWENVCFTLHSMGRTNHEFLILL